MSVVVRRDRRRERRRGGQDNPVLYQVDRESERVDHDALAKLAAEQRPKLPMIGTSSYPRAFDWPRLRAVADDVGATFPGRS